MKIMFGKHKGKELSEIPVEYLQWLIENSDVNDPKYGAKNQILVTACERQIASNVPAEDKKYYAKMAATNKANAKPHLCGVAPGVGLRPGIDHRRRERHVGRRAAGGDRGGLKPSTD